MSNESVTSFFNRYHRHPSRIIEERMVTPAFDLDYIPAPTYENKPTDIRILLPESKKEWRVHSDVITGESNFFRMALAGPFLESRTKEIKLYEIDDKIMEFVVKYMYKGWSSAATSAFGLEDGAAVPPSEIAEILIAADFLDVPRLCYAAYHMMLRGMVSVVVLAKTESPYSHVSHRARQPFLRAAGVLEKSKTDVGIDLAGGIRMLMEKLRKAWDLDSAVKAFVDAFPTDHSLVNLELLWESHGVVGSDGGGGVKAIWIIWVD
ncbi:hypothetical protein F5Y00DRAFT_273150 [Daldinia vernicosa]|uniref:uncharacterized protein n=1 Tax=Daldinia vernicosa TaxID=114800 RepID=UPI00200740BC|nr:uncharacterized protein F5Y00DRAFT_273150 [Daldinia vernicosa]KAI0852572.1 hypothetical protein F5Y00DRAFT_273150 [Daldinia vernicosa]